MIGFTVKLTPQQYDFLEQLKPTLNLQFGADVIRDIVEALRTSYGLPPYMVDVLERDRASRKLSLIGYTQELFARRYESLRDAERAAGEATVSTGDAAGHASAHVSGKKGVR